MLETERLLLLKTAQVTPQQLADSQQRNREFFRPYDPEHEEEYYTAAYWQATRAQFLAEEKTGRAYRYYLFLRDHPDQLIGYVTLTSIVRGAFQSCFLGYKMDEKRINHGYMTEALQAVIRDAFDRLRLHRIEANIMPRNKPSLRVAEKCGFINEGLSPRYLRINGKWEDHVHMVLMNGKME